MTTEIIIRAFEAADASTLAGIWLEASRLAHPFIGEARLLAQRPEVEAVWLPGAETLVARDTTSGAALGFVSLLGDFIGALFVAPGQQGRGIGRQLVAAAQARREGRALSLRVYAANAAATGFYLALGFREVARRDHDEEGLPFAELLMRRDP